jgi:hypothetical protein
MPSILIIEKLGSMKSVSVKSVVTEELYKKAGLKSPEGFKCQTQWNLEQNGKQYSIHLYAKTTGRANQENKYEFPPPMDKHLFFGKCILVNPSGELTVEMWNEFYESIMQFEDIEQTESSEEEDLPPGKYSHGYLKDDFVVSDNELEEEPYKIDLNKKV